jgi:hypothetical protein
VVELRLIRIFQLGNDPLRQHLAQFDAPLVEAVDLPNRPLGEYTLEITGGQR